MWPYNENDQPRPSNLLDYLVLENLTRRVNLPMFAERASTQDSPKLRKHLRDHVFIVRDRPEKGRREAKAQACSQPHGCEQPRGCLELLISMDERRDQDPTDRETHSEKDGTGADVALQSRLATRPEGL